jgi:hypothetical protein
MSDPRSERIVERARHRLGIAVVVGPLVGLAAGAAIGWIAYGEWGGGTIVAMVAGGVAGTLLALLLAGYSSLESPDPGKEPSDTVDPISDRHELVREETGDPPIPDGDRRG